MHKVVSNTTQVQKKLHHYSCRTAHQSLAFVRVVPASPLAEEDSASKQIDEMEEYLGLLQSKKAMILMVIKKNRLFLHGW